MTEEPEIPVEFHSSTDGGVESSQESLERLNAYLQQEALEHLKSCFRRSVSHEQIEEYVAAASRMLGVLVDEALLLCNRFLEQEEGMSWSFLMRLMADGAIRKVNNELVRVPMPPPLFFAGSHLPPLIVWGIDMGIVGTKETPKGIGDLTCEFNARSPELRCAIKPSGPCEACTHRTDRIE